MALVTLREILPTARREHYAVGGFDAKSAIEVKTIIETAAELRSPVIVQIYAGAVDCLGADALVALARTYAESVAIPVVLHLDHAVDVGTVKKCLDAGFPSVMIDGSAKPLGENIALTREVVEAARRTGASVEAELGKLGTLKGGNADFLTEPDEARRFVAETGIDALAVAIGTAHGFYAEEPRLDFDRLKELRDAVDVPLVMHGGSGTPSDAVTRAIELGIAKINIGSEIGLAFTRAMRQAAALHGEIIWSTQLMELVREKVGSVVRGKIKEFGSEGRA